MRKAIIGTIILFSILLSACNDTKKNNESDSRSNKGKDSIKEATNVADAGIKTVKPTFSSLDPKAQSYMRTLVGNYLQLKNALVIDNSTEAAGAGNDMVETMAKVDKSSFTAEQKKIYDANEDDLKENAEHIGKNTGNIEHQRGHFSMMSDDMYVLVKAYGGGRALYHDYCPMYDNKKAAMWLSELQEIKNPYLGKKMPRCGEVKEEIK